MRIKPAAEQSRREFFRTCARGVALGGLGLLGAALSRRKDLPRPAGETCISRSVCRGCPVFEGCGLPQALSAKNRGMKAEE